MIKARAEGPDGPIYLFGLEEENLKQLRDGEPIRINLAEMGLEGQAFIFYGRTMEDLVEMVRPAIGKDTKLLDLLEKQGGKGA